MEEREERFGDSCRDEEMKLTIDASVFVSAARPSENQYPISYNFLLIFRAEQTESEQEVKGTLKAGERKTGSNDGLYFLPFSDKRSIIEVGVKNIKVEKIAEGIK